MSYCNNTGNFIDDKAAHQAVIRNPYAWLRLHSEQTVKMNCKDDAAFQAYCNKQYGKLEQQQQKQADPILNQSVIVQNIEKQPGTEEELKQE